jgi:hypothetical protein
VGRGLGRDVAEGEALVVLVDDRGWDLFANNFRYNMQILRNLSENDRGLKENRRERNSSSIKKHKWREKESAPKIVSDIANNLE